MDIDMVEPLLGVIRTVQKVGSFAGGIMFICGIAMFLYTFKNPLRKRIAFLLTLMGPFILLLSIHGVVFIAHYMFSEPMAPNAKLGIFLFEPKLDEIGSGIYQAIQSVSYPIMVLVLLISIGILHHASRIPGRKRNGYFIFILVPLLYMVIEGGPWIYNILIS